MTDTIFEPDPWLYVTTNTAATARAFFGAPSDWPVEFVCFEKNGRRQWRVKAEGLTVK